MGARSLYDVLGLTGPPSAFGQEDIKTAYKKALLLHHPDKSSRNITSTNKIPPRSVDEIIDAFNVLSDAGQRAKYDREQTLSSARSGLGSGPSRTGLETVDLDDLTPLEDGEQRAIFGVVAADGEAWTRPCRCGSLYIITEARLERDSAEGEILVACDGCSLCLQVLFQAAG